MKISTRCGPIQGGCEGGRIGKYIRSREREKVSFKAWPAQKYFIYLVTCINHNDYVHMKTLYVCKQLC